MLSLSQKLQFELGLRVAGKPAVSGWLDMEKIYAGAYASREKSEKSRERAGPS